MNIGTGVIKMSAFTASKRQDDKVKESLKKDSNFEHVYSFNDKYLLR